MLLIVEIKKENENQDIKELIKKCDHLQQRIKNIRICEVVNSKEIIYTGKFCFNDNIKYKCIFYTNKDEIEQNESLYSVKMPFVKFKNLYDNLILDEDIKLRILKHFYKVYFMLKKKFDISAFDINKTALLYGPPGTGKTTLAKAIFYRLSIRMKEEVSFIEVNCTKLFSKFFGETLNSLLNLKQELVLMAKNKMIFVLFDEIESILISRSVILDHNEPLESARLVNSFLLFLDELKNNSNIFIIFTSNNHDKLDLAFLDRCDLRILIDIPDINNIYLLICNLFRNLMRQGLVASTDLNKSDKIYEVSSLLRGKSSRQIAKMVFESLNIKYNSVEEILLKIQTKIEVC